LKATSHHKSQKRREETFALPKLRETRYANSDFARSAFGVRCVFASLSHRPR
jgi:hypothetical protein